MPGSLEAWPASLTMSSFASGQARCRAQALAIGVTTSKRPWAIQQGICRMRPMFFSSQPSSGKKPPFTKTVRGAPVDALKAIVQAKKDVVIPVEVEVVVALTPAPPGKIELDFDAQPNLAVGF